MGHARTLVIAFASSLAALLAVHPAHAEPLRELPMLLPPLRPIGVPIVAAGHAPPRAHAGFLLGVETGYASMLAGGGDDARGAWSLAARAGYQLRNGLAFEARYDRLGVDIPTAAGQSGGTLQTGSAGLRYTLPAFFIEPFAEVLVGAAFIGGDPSFTGAFGGGLTLPVARHFSIDFGLRDWLVDVDDHVRHTLSAEAGITIAFASR